MSKPIKLTDELVRKIEEEFVIAVKGMKMSEGKINYSRSFEWEGEDKATVVFDAAAFAKMVLLLQNFDSEVAWHGTVERDDEDPSKFYIKDILVYPQTVTGSTVNTDQEAYQTWLYKLEDDVFNNLRMQGHSHVNFSTTPSGVDLSHQEKILTQVGDDDYYIFMIWNKKFEHTIKIFDMATNTLYENKDVDVVIGDDGFDTDKFVKGANEQVKKKYTYEPTGYGSGYTPKAATTVSASPPSTKSKSKSKKSKADIGSSGAGYDYGGYDDDGYGFYGYNGVFCGK